MLKRILNILCLIVLFAFSQQAAIAHEISHIQDYTHLSEITIKVFCLKF